MASNTRQNPEVRFLNGDFALVPRAEYDRLLAIEADAAEDEVASRIIAETKLALKEGREVLLPREIADRLMAGDSPVMVIREWRNLNQDDLASAAGISRPQLIDIEQGRRSLTVDLQERLARVLKVPQDVLSD